VTGSPATTGMWKWSTVLLLVGSTVFGCDDASRRASARLRTQVHELQQELAGTRLQIAELEGKLQAAGERHGLDGDVLANTPNVAKIAISPFSGMRRDDGVTSTIELYVSAVDGRGRPLQMVGTLEGKVIHAPMDGDPVELGHLTMDSFELRDAWRRGLDGTSYLMTIPLTEAVPTDVRFLHAQVLHTDARTDRPHEATMEVRPTPSNEE